MMVIDVCKVRLQPSKLVPKAYLGNGQGDHSPMMDAVKSDLPGTHRDVLEATHHQIAPGVQSLGGIIRRQLEGFQYLR